MIKERLFIITGLQPWGITIGSNAKDIAMEISKKNKVLYVSTPLDYITFLKRDNIQENVVRRRCVKGEISSLKKINKNLFSLNCPFTLFPINKLPDGIIFDLFNYLNNKKIFSFIKNYISLEESKNAVLLIDNDIYRSFYANELLKPKFSIYYRRDNLKADPFWMKHINRLENSLCAKCNIVLANSQYLADSVKEYNNLSFDIGQGVELSNYNYKSSYSIPKKLENIKKPIVGYIGWITSKRIDGDLIYNIATQLPEVSFVMAGSEDEYFVKNKLHTLNNIHFIGHINMDDVPQYIANFDICFNPQLKNDITIGNYPRKIDEYLAMGKEIIATKTDAMEMFKEYVNLCNNAEEYVESIKSIIENGVTKGGIEEKVAFAISHSWYNSVEKIYKYIERYE